MAGEPLLTITGNATGDAELRYLPNGTAVCAWNVAVTPRTKVGDEWKDGETTFFRCTAWREMAEQCAETITKGMRLIVHGRFKTRRYEKDGQERTSVEIDVEEVGPSLRYATAVVTKASKGGGQKSAVSEDPWATATPAGNRSGGGNFTDQPPF